MSQQAYISMWWCSHTRRHWGVEVLLVSTLPQYLPLLTRVKICSRGDSAKEHKIAVVVVDVFIVINIVKNYTKRDKAQRVARPTWANATRRTVCVSLRALTNHANASQDLRGNWTKVEQFCGHCNFSSTVLTQQSALRSAHPLSNKSGDI